MDGEALRGRRLDRMSEVREGDHHDLLETDDLFTHAKAKRGRLPSQYGAQWGVR